MNFIKNIITILFVLFVFFNFYIIYQNENKNSESNYNTQKTSLSTESKLNVENEAENSSSTEDMLDEMLKSVVGISKLTNTGGSILNNISSDELGLGTGIVVSENGYILSNSHVTGEKYSICYVTSNEVTYRGTVVWNDEDLDLSIVKIQASNLNCIDLGDSSENKIGETVYAIGNPIGYEFRQTVTAGIISALNRTIKIDENDESTYMSDLIQTDATINPGNSGGPLINSAGKVIGINTVKITSAEGIGFAIPINVIKPVINSFKEKGTFEEASLGLHVYDGDVAEYMNLKERVEVGIYVTKVVTENTGIEEGDIIKSIDGKILRTVNDLREYIYEKSPEDTVELKLIRNSKEIKVAAKLTKK